MFSYLAIALAGAAFLAATVAFARYAQDRRRRKESESWPTVRGRILTAQVLKETKCRRDEDGGMDETTIYTPDIRFTYRVAGRDYVTDTWKHGKHFGMTLRSFATETVALYPAGGSVAVYYDPARPEVAVLDPKNTDGSGLPIVVGVALGGIGFAALVVAAQAA